MRLSNVFFIWYGLQAGMKGCLIGIVLGIILALNLTTFIQGIEWVIGKKLLSGDVFCGFLAKRVTLVGCFDGFSCSTCIEFNGKPLSSKPSC